MLALGLSGILLVTGYLVFTPGVELNIAAASGKDLGPRTIQGADLQFRLGTGSATQDGAILLTGLDKVQTDRAILTRKTSFEASDYAFIEYDISGRHPKESIFLLWRTADHPGEVSNTPLQWQGDAVGILLLASHPEWSGRITEIGLDIYGELREQPLNIAGMTLLPASRMELLQTIWFEWTAFRGWTQKSANFLLGAPIDGILSPTLAMAAWSGLALVTLAGVGLFRKSHNLVAYTSVALVPWIGLDLLWQADLSRQLEETKYLFAGKSQHERLLADVSPELYEYAEYLKQEVLPEPGVRIFLLHDSDPMTYTRLKTQYYLLPHNVFNYDRFPRKKATRAGDYILILGNVDGLDFSPGARTLQWQGKSLPVKLIDSRPEGSLYQVIKREGKPVEPSG